MHKIYSSAKERENSSSADFQYATEAFPNAKRTFQRAQAVFDDAKKAFNEAKDRVQAAKTRNDDSIKWRKKVQKRFAIAAKTIAKENNSDYDDSGIFF